MIMRLEKLKNLLKHHDYDAVALNAGPMLTYLTGMHFHLSERPVVALFCPDADPVIVLPELEKAKLDGAPFSMKTCTYGENPSSWQKVFNDACGEIMLGSGRIGIEPRQLRVLEYELLKDALPSVEFVDGSNIFSSLRAVKDAAEIGSMRQAVKIAEDALEATVPAIKEGVTEKEIASELFYQLLQKGSDAYLPFSPIVAGGPNSANPHATPTRRKLAGGDLLIIDWGASFSGYFSDLTRTFAIGEVGETEKRIHDLVRQANREGRRAGGAGVTCSEVDRAARDVIESGGYGEYFIHRTGHGLGAECHEEPYIHGDNEQILEVGMTYTVEPGIYLPGRNGVRIEDDVMITPNGAESLSTMTRELRRL